MRVNFNQLFSIANGAISPKTTIQIGGVTMGPGVSFGGGVSMGGVDLSQHVGKDFEVEEQNGVYVITSIYN